ncbi:MAG TPA: hypothetical protein VEO54_28550 [Thermoanaerobaculia bacterium]|nr:hypothetical protein [Thermoanaerobaculia bacterium]
MKRVAGMVVVVMMLAVPLQAGTMCEMTFTMSGWSAFYKTSSGTGTIKCDNGQKAKVKVSSKGGGVTFGRSKIKDAIGKFTEVDDISELFGSYGQGEAHAGAGKSAKASVVTKGDISLAIAGKGTGVDVGVSFGKFTIEKVK